MKATDLRFLATLNAAQDVDELEQLFQDIAPGVQIDIDSDSQILIRTGKYAKEYPSREIKR
mgnify:FL=1